MANDISVDKKTIESWISVLIAGNIIYLLQPYYENSVTKRVVKRSKVYFSDTGLACYLAKVNTRDSLINSYLKEKMVETYIINEIIKSYKNNVKDRETSFYYYRDFDKNEIDLIVLCDGSMTLIECKSGESYSLKDVKGFMKLKDTKYKLEKKAIICTTKEVYSLGDSVYVLPISVI